MTSQKREDPKKTPEKTQRKEELSDHELAKVSGGLKRNKTGDPCDGGE
jgi:bacteriocin-like protein